MFKNKTQQSNKDSKDNNDDSSEEDIPKNNRNISKNNINIPKNKKSIIKIQKTNKKSYNNNNSSSEEDIPKAKTRKTSADKTQYFEQIFDDETADNAYIFLKDNITWEDGIYSRMKRKHSRKAYYHDGQSDTTVDLFITGLVNKALNKIGTCTYYGVYVNYYQNGNDFCPRHSHKDTIQLVLSFGAIRTLTVGKKEYRMFPGDGILFGSSIHGIPEEPEIEDGRISIAIFIVK